MNESKKLFCSNHGFKCFWTVKGFTRCSSNNGLRLYSSKFSVNMLLKSEWYITIRIFYKTFGVFLSKINGVSFEDPVNYSIHILTSEGWQMKTEGYDHFDEEGQSYGIGYLRYDKLLNETLTLCIHMWNGTTRGENDQCVMTSQMLDDTEILHFPFQELPLIKPRDLIQNTIDFNNSVQVSELPVSERIRILASVSINVFEKLERLVYLLEKLDLDRLQNSFQSPEITAISDKGTQTEAADNSNVPKDLQDLHHLFKEKKLSYVFFRTEKMEFAAHKALLCAQSPVFKAMFDEDKTGNGTKTVEVKDIDSETLSLLLQFLHLEPLESLKWNSAAKLFHAADKYEIEHLKTKCISVLKMELTEENVCEAYVLADILQQNELMQTVLEYFAKNSKKVFCSSEWKSFILTKTELASEILCKLTEKFENCKN